MFAIYDTVDCYEYKKKFSTRKEALQGVNDLEALDVRNGEYIPYRYKLIEYVEWDIDGSVMDIIRKERETVI